MTTKAAYNFAIKLLTMRDYSQYKMREKLISKGFSDVEVDETIEKLVSQKYINDKNYQRGRVKQLLLKSHSNDYIIKKCELEHLYPDHDFIENLREEFNLGSDDMIKELIQKKLKSIKYTQSYEDKQKAKSKIYNFLKSKGHSSYHLIELIDSYL